MSPEGVRRRVIVLGLDGATWDLLTPLMEEGYLPNLARLRAESAWGALASTTPPFSATAWTTFATGVNPGKHGVFDFWYHGPDGRRLPIDATSVRAPTLWHRLSDAGRRVAVIGVPVTYPPTPVNGVMVSGLLTPPGAAAFTHPASLAEELRAAAGAYRPDPYAAITQSTAFLREALYWTEQQERAHRYLLAREPWDCFIQVTQATDAVQHFFWTYLRPGHADYHARGAATYRALAMAVFRHLDDIVGRRAQELGADDILLLMSDHGFGEATHWFNLNRFLAETGFLALARRPALARSGLTQERILGTLRRLDVFGLRGLLRNRTRLKFRQQIDRLVAPPIDWARTRAYAASTSAEAVYLNVRGREPDGIVAPGAEYERVRDEIIQALKEARDPATGREVFAAVYRREELYHGPYLERAPDILLEVGDRPYVLADRLGSTSVFERIPRQAARGRHRPAGILMAYGGPVRAGAQVNSARLVDLAPTILALMGLPVPQEMDGRVLTELFSDVTVPGISSPPVADDGRRPAANESESGYSPEEAAWVEKRLRSLGYLG
jgi:predicted AlkP superfamily phosphohydrolase/phosphomutase